MEPLESRSLLQFWAPQYWFTWLVYAWMRAIVFLPFSWQLWLGKRLGRALQLLLYPRRHIAERNLSVCFPELSDQERNTLQRRHFEAIGASVTEMSMAWFGSKKTIRDLIHVEGEENLRDALAKGKGVILFCAHFTTFEFFSPTLEQLCPTVCAMYRIQRNEMMNVIMTRGRRRSIDKLFQKNSPREMLRSLAENAVVWYAADQSYRGKYSALVPFFDVPAMTNTATSRLVKMSGATLLTYFGRRLPDDSGYVLNIGAPLENFPSDDLVEDSTRLMKELETYVRQCPEQYCWIHRRFKGRPEPYPDLYQKHKQPA
ncbi:MAG: lipid A biosynthesis acyltransferase [Gammaproteobacteria bacterium]|nr:lipid A biosynthesis acyltransferase [Gammaproteobacteria bacterium]